MGLALRIYLLQKLFQEINEGKNIPQLDIRTPQNKGRGGFPNQA